MLCETKNMLCETQNMLYANTYHISKNDLRFHEWNLDFGTLRNLTFHEWNLDFGTSRNLTFHEWNLHFRTSRNLMFHEWNLHFGTSRDLTFHEWNLHFGTSRNLTFHEWNLDFGTSRNLTFHEWNLHFGTGSIPSEPLGTWCKVSGGCPKPPRSFIGRTPSLSGCWGKTKRKTLKRCTRPARASRQVVKNMRAYSKCLMDFKRKGTLTGPSRPGTIVFFCGHR